MANFLEKIKELETAQNYSEMLSILKEQAALLTQGYSHVNSIITNPTIEGILRSLEEISVSATTLLRHCENLLEEEVFESPQTGELDTSTIPLTSPETSREIIRDNTFTLQELERVSSEFPQPEAAEASETLEAKFWYIKGGQNEAVNITASGKEIFGMILIKVLNQVEASPNEKFSISPLGFEALLQYQFHNSLGQITKSYGEEFTLIKLYI